MAEVDRQRLQQLDGIKWSKYGADVLPAWVADMDFAAPEPVRSVIADLAGRSDLGYSFSALDALIPTWADWQQRHHGWRPLESQCQVFTGTLHALEALLVLHTRPGDGVVLFSPIYQPFRTAIEAAGRRVVDVPLDPSGWRLDPDRLAASCDAQTRLVLMSQPHNPVGRIFGQEELRGLADVAERRDLMVISDEIWADLRFGAPHLPLVMADERLVDRTVTIGAPSKTFNLAGVRCAVAHVGVAALRRALAAFPPHLLGGPSTISAAAAVAAWTQCDDWLDDVLSELCRRRTQLADRLARDLPEVDYAPPAATYLAWLDLRRAGLGDAPAKAIFKRSRVALEPGEKFGAQCAPYARLNLATSEEILDEMLDRMVRTVRGGLDATGAAP